MNICVHARESPLSSSKNESLGRVGGFSDSAGCCSPGGSGGGLLERCTSAGFSLAYFMTAFIVGWALAA